MLRRSFAEFHAQRAQPGKTAALAAGQAQLAAYSATPWHTCIKGCDRWALKYLTPTHRLESNPGTSFMLPCHSMHWHCAGAVTPWHRAGTILHTGYASLSCRQVSVKQADGGHMCLEMVHKHRRVRISQSSKPCPCALYVRPAGL
jgi:hypothetical protein